MADLITLEELKDYLGSGAKQSSGNDALLSASVAAASRVVQEITNQPWVQVAHAPETRDGNGLPYLELADYPVDATKTFTVTENGLALSTSFGYSTTADVVVGIGDQERQKPAWIQRTAGVWAAGFQNVAIAYTAGLAAVPPSIKELTKYLSARFFKEPNAKWVGLARRGASAHSADFLQNLPDLYKEIVRRNKRVYFAR